MPEKPFVPNQLDDVLSSFEAGMNAGIAPQLLQRNQLGNAFNATMRGDFATNRPPFNLMVLNYFGSTDIQNTVENGLYQGCAYYKDRYGNPYLVASFSGRIFLFTPNTFGFTVTEITIPGDPNSATSPQAWIWQAEDFVICNDGQSNPFIYDGTTSRRATQGSATIATTAAPATAVPAQGSSATVNTTAPYTGAFNILVAVYNAAGIFLGYFQTLQSNTVAPTYTVQLTNQSGAAQTVNTNDQVIVPGSPGQTTFVGKANAQVHVPGNGGTATIPFIAPIAANLYRVNQAQSMVDDQGHQMFGTPLAGQSSLTVQNVQGQAGFDMLFRHDISTIGGSNQPPTSAYPVGVVANGPYTFGVNQTLTVTLQQPYIGPNNQLVTINGKQYNIAAPATTPPAASLTLLNITATAGGSMTVGSTIRTVPEIPPGRMGVYGLGRNWVALTDGRSFIASDLVGSSSGTPAYGKRDAVLRTQHNTLLASGGAFVVPSDAGEIQAMQFVTILDASLGQGPLMVHTPDVVFSCQAPPDETTWQTVTNPILTEAYKPQGGLSQRSTINVNGDSIYRSVDGIRSLILARKDFDVWGNVPASFEVDPTLREDDQSLLQFSSAVNFDNRVLMTATPKQGPTGAYFTNIIALNLDPISSLRGKQPAIYDGIWTGLNVLNLVVGRFVNIDRAFAFAFNTDTNKNELHEVLASASEQSADNSINAIVTDLEFPPLYFGDQQRPIRPLKRLIDGELYVDELQGTHNPNVANSDTVTFSVYFRADFDSVWHLWRTWTIKDAPPWQSRMGLGEPPATTDPLVNRPWREGYIFQMRVVVTGKVIIKGARFRTTTIPESAFAPIPKSVV